MRDALILKLGRRLCSKFGGDSQQFNYIRSKLRLVARLLICLRRVSGQPAWSMSDFINPTQFKYVVEAAKECAGFTDSKSQYKVPSNALKSGAVLRTLAEIKQGEALERSDSATAETCVQFLKLCDLNWSCEVSSVALRNISDRKRTSCNILPLTEDVLKLNDFIVNEVDKVKKDVDSSHDAFMTLTQLALAKVLLFNRKRQGEVSRITIADYNSKMRSDDTHEMAQALSEFERNLLKVLERIEIRGKRGRTVPELLTEQMNQWLVMLLANREHFVPVDNPFLFATATEQSHFRGSDVLRKYSVECGAKQPHTLTSTKLRKHIASTAQVVSLKENELDSLASFLGHDLCVHTNFYRLPSDVIEIARVSKLFLAAEKGNLASFSGKHLSDIEIGPHEEVQTSSDECNDNDDECEESVQITAVAGESDQMEIPADENDKMSIPNTISVSMVRDRKQAVKKKWTQEEKKKVATYFANVIMDRQLPGKVAIQQFLEKSGLQRSWTNVKDHIRNEFLK